MKNCFFIFLKTRFRKINPKKYIELRLPAYIPWRFNLMVLCKSCNRQEDVVRVARRCIYRVNKILYVSCDFVLFSFFLKTYIFVGKQLMHVASHSLVKVEINVVLIFVVIFCRLKKLIIKIKILFQIDFHVYLHQVISMMSFQFDFIET